MKTATALTLVISALLPSLAGAAISGTTGNIIQIGSPVSCLPGALTANNAWCWDEQQNVFIPGLPMDLSTNPSSNGSPVFGIVGGYNVDSHFIHFDGGGGAIAVGTVSFTSPILAVQYRDTFLDLSDPITGALGTIYPTTMPFRGINATALVSINSNVLTFQLLPNAVPGDIEQIRVFTHVVPAPGAAALLGMGGLCMVRRRR